MTQTEQQKAAKKFSFYIYYTETDETAVRIFNDMPYAIIDEAVFTTLYQAMIQNRTIEFDYCGVLDSGKVHRRVRPYQLLPYCILRRVSQ